METAVDKLLIRSMMEITHGAERDRPSSKQYEAFAHWLERVAILLLASFVVGSIVQGSSFTDPIVLVGSVAAVSAYYGAVYLMLKS